MNARRSMSVGGTVLVGVIAGAASYTHMREVAEATHQGALIGALLPLSVDGLILVATLAIGDGRTSTLTAWLAFTVGVSASLAANIAAADPSAAARIVSAWPSVAFLLSVEVLLRHRRRPEPLPVTPTPTPPTASPAVTVKGRGATTVTPTTAPNAVRAAATGAPARAARGGTATRIAAARRRWPDATIVQIAARADVSESTARRYLAALRPADDGNPSVSPDL